MNKVKCIHHCRVCWRYNFIKRTATGLPVDWQTLGYSYYVVRHGRYYTSGLGRLQLLERCYVLHSNTIHAFPLKSSWRSWLYNVQQYSL